MRRRRDILLPFYAAKCILLPADNEGRHLVWPVSEDTLSIETLGAEFSFTLPYFGVRSRAGRERRRVEDGRRNFSLLPLPNVERPEGAPTRYLDFCRLCRSFSMLQEKFILTQNYLLLSLTLLCISACKSVSLGPICPRVDGHLSENTRTPSHSTSPLATFSLLL